MVIDSQKMNSKKPLAAYKVYSPNWNIEEWFCYADIRHRDDGPAVVWPSGSRLYFINGKLIEEK